MRTSTFRALATAALLLATAAACSKTAEPDRGGFTPSASAPLPPPPKSLESHDDLVGSGREAKTGDSVKVQYTGTLLDGVKFDSSLDHGGDPFSFKIGAGNVIKGWDQGVVGMKVGGKRTLTIPPDLGYGAAGSPPNIPPNAGLKFAIELVSID